MLWKAASDFCENRSVILAKSENDFGKIGVWFCENQLVMLWKAASDFCENRTVILAKSENDFVKIGVWFWIDKFLLKIRLYHKSFYIHYLIQYLRFFYLPGVILHKLKGWWQDGMRRDCLRFMTRLYETGLHPFFDKMVWDRTASIFMTRWRETGLHSFFVARLYETGLHPFLWQDCMRQDCIHFYDKMAKTGLHSFLWQAIIRPVLIHFYDKPS